MHINHMLIHTKNNTNHYESTYMQKPTICYPIGKILTLQSRAQKYNAFLLKVK